MSKKTGLLLNVSGIQKYIFGTSRLRQIVGASGNVRRVLSQHEGFLQKTIQGSGEIKYTGGGNALLLFNSQEDAIATVQVWSLAILEEFPGINPAAGIYEGDFSDESFGKFLKECRNSLQKSKNEHSTNITLPRYGITAECNYTGDSAQFYRNIKSVKGKDENISIIAQTKYDGYDDADNRFKKDFGCDFSDNFEELAGKTKEGYRAGMAIIHIDGNDMGKMFSGLNTFEEFIEQSEKVKMLFNNALNDVTAEIENIRKDHHGDMGLINELIPFRPIIVGGDDITYVCHSSLGLWSAHQILKHIADQQKGKNNPITACAGIAFTKPSYPFVQGYQLAEDLCGHAKEKRRKAISESSELKNISYLDFHILKGGAFSDLASVREQGYKSGGKDLTGRPFGIEKGQEAYEWLVHTGKQIATGGKKWPKNKIKELRDAAYKGDHAEKALYTHMEKQNKMIPEFESRDPRSELGIPKALDLCEFLDVYPVWLLDRYKNKKIEENK